MISRVFFKVLLTLVGLLLALWVLSAYGGEPYQRIANDPIPQPVIHIVTLEDGITAGELIEILKNIPAKTPLDNVQKRCWTGSSWDIRSDGPEHPELTFVQYP